MAISAKVERENLRNKYFQKMIDFFEKENEEVLVSKSNTFSVPIVGEEGNEYFLKVTVSIPTGSNKGLDPYDGYAEAEEYLIKLKANEEKKKKKEEEKQKKIARDKAIREKKEKISEKREK